MTTYMPAATTYRDAHPLYRSAGWTGPLPLTDGTKWPPPEGWTGWHGAYPSYADSEAWCDCSEYSDTHQLGLRMADDVIGIDVDHYGEKRGADTIAEAESRWGPLPDGPRSSARGDGPSGIRFFRVPRGTVLRTVIGFRDVDDNGKIRHFGSVEIIQRHHRYAVVWPSVHPTGATYLWYGTDRPDDPPHVADLPALPPAWIDALASHGEPGEAEATPEQVKAFALAHSTGDRSASLNGPVAIFRRDVQTGLARHDAMLNAACMAAREARAGAYPAGEACRALRDEFVLALAEAKPGQRLATPAESRREFASIWGWAVGQALAMSIEQCRARIKREAPSDGPEPEPRTEQGEDVEPDPDEVRRRMVADQAESLRIRRAAARLVDAEERGPVAPPSSTSLAELLREEPAAVKYRVEGLWPSGGKVLVTAAKKSGKTTMVGNLVRCLVDGDRFLGRPFTASEGAGPGFNVTTDGRVVFLLDFEMTRDMLREWLRDQQIEGVDRVHVELMRGRTLDLRDDNVRAQWAAYLRSLDVGTLIVDPIGPVIHGLGIDENDNSEVGAFLTALDKLCLEAGVSEYAVVHHAGHGEEQRSRGASAFVGWPDAWWQITRSDDGSFLRAEGRDVALDETHLVFNAATRHLTLGEGSRRDAKGAADVVAVADLVKQNPGATRNDLTKLLRDSDGWGTQRSRDAIASAVKARVVHHHPGANRAQHHHPDGGCERCPVLVPG